MVEFINAPVVVEVHLRSDGALQPLAFVWRGQRFQVRSWGRESEEMRGGQVVRCYLVQTAGSKTWELCHEKETAHWLLVRAWAVGPRTV